MNFANSFSIWERLFGTMVYGDTNKIRYGIDTLDNSLDDDIGFQMKVPFDYSVQVTRPDMEV